jgi:hypothetical protein
VPSKIQTPKWACCILGLNGNRRISSPADALETGRVEAAERFCWDVWYTGKAASQAQLEIKSEVAEVTGILPFLCIPFHHLKPHFFLTALSAQQKKGTNVIEHARAPKRYAAIISYVTTYLHPAHTRHR